MNLASDIIAALALLVSILAAVFRGGRADARLDEVEERVGRIQTDQRAHDHWHMDHPWHNGPGKEAP